MNKQQLQELEIKAIDQLRSGEPLFGKDGAFAPLVKRFVEKALEGEMEIHLNKEERTSGNKRNGKGKRQSKVQLEHLLFQLLKTEKAVLSQE